MPSLAPRPAGWRGLKGNEDTELTTQHGEGQEMRRGYHIRQGRGLRSVPCDGGGDLMGRFMDSGLFWDTHARRLCRPFLLFFPAMCIPCYAEATGQWDCCCCTISFLLRLALIYGRRDCGRELGGIMIWGSLKRDFSSFFVVGLTLIEDITCEY